MLTGTRADAPAQRDVAVEHPGSPPPYGTPHSRPLTTNGRPVADLPQPETGWSDGRGMDQTSPWEKTVTVSGSAPIFRP